jgi:hypothetical protein
MRYQTNFSVEVMFVRSSRARSRFGCRDMLDVPRTYCSEYGRSRTERQPIRKSRILLDRGTLIAHNWIGETFGAAYGCRPATPAHVRALRGGFAVVATTGGLVKAQEMQCSLAIKATRPGSTRSEAHDSWSKVIAEKTGGWQG